MIGGMTMETTQVQGAAYQGYTKGLDVAEVRKRFKAKYGREAHEVIDGGTIWLCGPVAPIPTATDETGHTGPIEQLALFGGDA
jgi:hypothetical protein